MNRLTAFSFALLLAAGASAESADVRTSVTGPDQLTPGAELHWTATVENAGPDAAHNVFFTAAVHPSPLCHQELIPLLAPGERRVVECASTLPAATYAVQIQASAHGETPELNPDDNLTWKDIDVLSPPDLQLFLYAPSLTDRGAPFEVTAFVRNRARVAATGVTLTVDASTAIIAVSEGCSISGSTATCTLGTLEPSGNAFDPRFDFLRFRVVAPDESEAPVTMRASIRLNEDDPNPTDNAAEATTETYQTFIVTNANDSGSGSLRATIEEANATCHAAPNELCKLEFRIPPGAAQWVTIRPETPLPAITADRLMIDGLSQTRFAGETNLPGPEIEIRGDLLAEGDGFVIASKCGASVNGLAINGFPGSGVLVAGGPCDGVSFNGVGANVIGTDPTGTRAVPNGRGVMVSVAKPDWVAQTYINANVISGNRHSGIWVESGSQTRNNYIGLTRGATAGLGNGASGVYIAAGGSGTDVVDNYIGFNLHAGVSMDPNTVQVETASNSFQANGGLAIDHGLDGVSPVIPDVGERPGNSLHAPVITSARYDASSNTTVVDGMVDVQKELGFRSLRIALYANAVPDDSGFGEGQYLLGYTHPDTEGRFTFRYDGRTPGPWIAATANSYSVWGFARTPKADANLGGYASTTSEFSRTVEVSQ